MNGGSHNSPPVELHVTNLDQSIEPADLKRILTACFSEHVSSGGAHVSVFTQSDGTVAAAVKLRWVETSIEFKFSLKGLFWLQMK